MNSHLLGKAMVCAALFAGVAAFDFLTGYEVSSYPVYLLPIFLAFFNFGKVGGYLACVIAIGLWTVIDIANHHLFSHEFLRYWNAGSRLMVYMLFVYGLSIYVKTVDVHRRRLEDMRRLIPICHGCGKIRWVDGTWKTPREVLREAGGRPPECPSCAKGQIEESGGGEIVR